MVSYLTRQLSEQFTVPPHLTGAARKAAVVEQIFTAVCSLLGAGGAVWLALRIKNFPFAYIPFLASSFMLAIHFYKKKQGWLMLQQAVYTIINISGVYCWILTKDM